jgi:TP901 family phage tail tape measure protein
MRVYTIPTRFTAIDKFSGPVDKMSGSVSAFANRTQRDFRKAGSSAISFAKSTALVGAAVIAPLGLMAKKAIEFEDKMADVAKTTGLSGKPLEDFGNGLLDLSRTTRTSIEDLQKIAEIGGQLGISEKELLSFTSAADKFNIALGKDFAGGVEEAVSQVGKIKNLFKESRSLDISDAIMRTGSAINDLGAVGAGTSYNISDFTLRLGALPEALKPSISNTLALGTYLEELGVDAQIGASGMSNFLTTAGERIGLFAREMKISENEAKALLSSDPTEFAKRFSSTFKGMKADVLATKLKKLGVGSLEVIKVIGALGSNTKRLTELQDVANKSYEKGSSLQEEAAKKNATMAAKAAMLKNNIQNLAIKLGTALLPVINSIVSALVPFIDRISRWISQNKQLTATIIKVVAIAGALALAISGVSFAVGVYQKAVVIAKAVQLAWNTAMALSPVGLMITSIAALAVGISAVSEAFDSQTEKQKIMNSIQQRAIQNTLDQRAEVMVLFDSLKRSAVGSDQFNASLKRLDQIQPGITRKYNLQEKALDGINRAQREIIFNIDKRAKAEAAFEIKKEKYKELMTARSEGTTTGDFFRGFKHMFTSMDATGAARAERIQEIKESIEVLNEQEILRSIDPNKSKNEALINGLKGKIESEVNVNIQGAPEGSKATASSNSIWKMPLLTSTTQ